MLGHWLKRKGEKQQQQNQPKKQQQQQKDQATTFFVSEKELWESLEMCLRSTLGISFELVGCIFILAVNQPKDHLLWNKGTQTSGYYSNSHKLIAYWY